MGQFSRLTTTLRNRRRLILAGAGGILLALCFPPFHQYYLVPTAFLALAYAVRNGTTKQVMVRASTFAVIFYLLHAYWFASFHFFALPLFLVAVAVYFGLYGYGLARIGINPWTIAGTWMLLQYVVGSGPFAFPWSRILTALAAEPVLVQGTRYFGEILLGGFWVLLGSSVAFLDRRSGRWALVLSLVMLVTITVQGYERVRTTELEPTDVEVAMVQPNVMSTFDISGQPPRQSQVLRRMTGTLEGSGLLIVWPETALSGYPFELAPSGNGLRYRNALVQFVYDDLLDDVNRLLSGFKIYDDQPERLNRLNGAVLIHGDGTPRSFYTKRILVPFGEYIPGMGRWEVINTVGRLIGTLGYRSGDVGGLIPLSGGENGLPAAVQICFEDAFPAYVYRQVRDGAEVLVNISNDSWSRSRAAHWQHFYRAKLRAVETGRTMLRNGNTGVTAIIDPLGRTHSLQGPFVRGVSRGNVFKPLPESFIVRNYSTTSLAGAVVFLAAGFLFFRFSG